MTIGATNPSETAAAGSMGQPGPCESRASERADPRGMLPNAPVAPGEESRAAAQRLAPAAGTPATLKKPAGTMPSRRSTPATEIDFVRQAFARALPPESSGEKMSEARAQQLITTIGAGCPASHGRLTASMMAYVAKQLGLNAGRIDPTARDCLRAFIDGKGGDTGVIEPKIMGRNLTGVDIGRYEAISGSLFGPMGPQYDDMMQGEAGDCYYDSVISAWAWTLRQGADLPTIASAFTPCTVAEARQNPLVPTELKRDLDDAAPGSQIFLVRMYRKLEDGRFAELQIPVDAEMPANETGQLYDVSRDADVIWVQLMEKAWAEFNGGWDVVGNGGRASAAMEALLGRPAVGLDIGKMENLEVLYGLLEMVLPDRPNGAKVVTVGSKHRGRHTTRNGDIVADHDYTVLGLKTTSDGKRWVELYNPQGSTIPTKNVLVDRRQAAAKHDGTFWYSLDALARKFDELCIGGLSDADMTALGLSKS